MYFKDRVKFVSTCCSRLVIALKNPSCTVGEEADALDVPLLRFFETDVDVAVLLLDALEWPG